MISVDDADFTLYQGDCAEILPTLPSWSVHCCVTSPPYFGLRDYDDDAQIGQEPTPAAYIGRLVGVLREVRRVLRADGSLWLNLGDSYNSGSQNNHGKGGTKEQRGLTPDGWAGHRDLIPGLKQKDLIGIPWRVALALQADGWWLRSDIIWSKPNPMPESITDRPTNAHEYVFLLTKSAHYHFDQDAVREPHSPDGRRITTVVGGSGSIQHRDGERWPNGGRNIRSVWEIPTENYDGAHFAVFPRKLARRCIEAGCPEGGTVLDPFIGSGTTALVARALGRRTVGIELNPEYCQLAAARLAQQSLLA